MASADKTAALRVLAVLTLVLVAQLCRPATAVLCAQSPTFGVGRAARGDEIAAIDIDVTPDGRGLPPGRGTAAAGKAVYAAHCVTCHGATGKEGPQDVLAGGQGTLAAPKPLKTVGSYWPYSTIVFDYVRRAMPFDHPCTLPVNDVYAVTAYVLYLNTIVGEQDVIDQTTLPKVRMPNRDGFVGDPRPDTGAKKR
jgi:S-disulfanyl-L-cysteine oxidoreductase SoxD